jgi:hypothetical protein
MVLIQVISNIIGSISNEISKTKKVYLEHLI